MTTDERCRLRDALSLPGNLILQAKFVGEIADAIPSAELKIHRVTLRAMK